MAFLIALKIYVADLKNSVDMGQQDELQDLLLHYRVADEGAIREEKERSDDG